MPKAVNKPIRDLSPMEIHSMRIREKLKGLPPTEKLRAWYNSEIPFELSDKELEIKARWEMARTLFMDMKTYSEIVDAMVAELGISPESAKIAIREMRYTFGDTDAISKEAHRQRAIQMALKAFNQAAKDEDSIAMSKAQKQYLAATGVDKDDPERLDIEKMMSERTYVEVLDPQVRDMLLGIIQNFGGVVDSSKVFEFIMAAKGTVDVEHEVVK